LKSIENYGKNLIKIQVDVATFKKNIAIIREHIGPQTKLIFVAKSQPPTGSVKRWSSTERTV